MNVGGWVFLGFGITEIVNGGKIYISRKCCNLFIVILYVVLMMFMFNLPENIEGLSSYSQLSCYFTNYQKYLIVTICFRLLKLCEHLPRSLRVLEGKLRIVFMFHY